MKKVIRLLGLVTIAVMLLCCTVFAETVVSGDFTYDTDGTLLKYTGTDTFVIPEEIPNIKITKLADKLFYKSDVAYVTMENITEIGKSAFESSKLLSADITETVMKIGDNAFSNCKDLEMIFFNGKSIPELGSNAFSGTGHLMIYIPCTADENSFSTAITAAKGDSNFDIDLIHEWVDNGTVDEYGSPEYCCYNCGEMMPSNEPTEGAPPAMPFTDVSYDSWYYEYVQIAYDFEIIKGKTETTFDPDANMTLAEAAKIAACLCVYQKGGDIAQLQIQGDNEHWYDTYVDYCYSEGIIEDYIVFDWNKKATRGEMAYMFSRANIEPHYINPDVPLTDIPDVSDTTPYAYEILDLYRNGIAAGSDEKLTFHPESNVKRSEVSTFIARFLCYDLRADLPKG